MPHSVLATRMKQYEEVPRTVLTHRMPMILRVDGRAFHTYTRKLHHAARDLGPWNPVMRDAMTDAARALVKEVSGAKLAYIQSDEISVLVTDYDAVGTQPWFDKVVQKVCSVSASVATMAFNNNIRQYVDSGLPAELFPATATFDARAFVVPQDDVCNYFIWRQRDAEKNSISMLAQDHFSPKQLHGKNGNAKQDMLMLEKGVNWNDCDTWKKRGWCVDRKTVTMTVAELQERGGEVKHPPGVVVPPETEVTRTVVDPDWEIPVFTKDRWYVNQHVHLDEARRRREVEIMFEKILGPGWKEKADEPVELSPEAQEPIREVLAMSWEELKDG